MFNMTETRLSLSKASMIMGSWGLLILLAGAISQWFELPNPNYSLLLWGGVSLLGVVAQAVGMVRGLGMNFGLWLVLIVVGWAFTLYVVSFNNGANMNLFGDLSGVWLILLGIGYTATAFQVDRRFLLAAVISLVGGVLLEASARGVMRNDFLDGYSAILFGVLGGLPLLIAALPHWVRQRVRADVPFSPVR